MRKICFTVIVLFSCAAFCSTVFSQSSDEAQIYQLVNNERMRSRLTPLQWDGRLGQVARSYSKKMAREHFFSHYDGTGNSVAQRSASAGVGYWQKIGENLYMMSEHPQYAALSVRSWMRSPPHRKNIKDRDWTSTGIGVARSSDGFIYVTQVFLRR